MIAVRNDPMAITRLFGTGLEEMDVVLTHVKRGTSYNIVCIAIREEDHVPMMVYKDVDSGNRWTRPIAEFFSRNEDGSPKWRWNRKAERIMEMIQSALQAYELGRTSRKRAGSASS